MVAVDAVMGEPLSGSNSLLSGNFAGNSAKEADNCELKRFLWPKFQELNGQFPKLGSREISWPKQGKLLLSQRIIRFSPSRGTRTRLPDSQTRPPQDDQQ
jgi:hypothetical protein